MFTFQFLNDKIDQNTNFAYEADLAMDSFRGRPSITTEEKRLESKMISLLIEKFQRQLAHALVKDWYL